MQNYEFFLHSKKYFHHVVENAYFCIINQSNNTLYMSKTFNIYCDESCHLEHDHKLYMFLGSVSCAYPQVQVHSQQIKEMKAKHNFMREIKWSTASKSKLKFYLDLVDYFFATDMCFRAVGVEKAKIQCTDDTSYDDFYYKMYYQLINYRISSMYSYNVYLDIKDTLSANKVRKLRNILNNKYNAELFRNIQNIRSEESVLMQLADFIMGAVSYNGAQEFRQGTDNRQNKETC